MNNNAPLTRTLLIAFPITFVAAYFAAGLYASLPVLVVGSMVLVARRRSLPEAIVGAGRGPWWVWTLAGLAMIGISIGLSLISAGDDSEDTGELGWMLFSLLFFVGSLIVAASIVRALALKLRRPSTPA